MLHYHIFSFYFSYLLFIVFVVIFTLFNFLSPPIVIFLKFSFLSPLNLLNSTLLLCSTFHLLQPFFFYFIFLYKFCIIPFAPQSRIPPSSIHNTKINKRVNTLSISSLLFLLFIYYFYHFFFLH